MHRRPWLLLLLATAALFLAAPKSLADTDALKENETLKLPTGRTITVLSISKVEYSKGVMALMVRYQTSLSVDESTALTEEVDDLWKIAVKDVERDGYSDAIISSNEIPRGLFLTASHMLNFIFEKGPDGKWTRLNRADFMAFQ